MDGAAIDRRAFLESGVMAWTLAAAGRLPLVAAEPRSGSGIDPAVGPYAIKPIRGYVERFAPAGGTLRGREEYALTFDILHWSGADRRAVLPAIPVVGTVTIRRAIAAGGPSYEIEQRTRIGGVDNVIEARVACDADPWNPLRAWTMRSRHTRPDGGADPESELVEKGRRERRRIEVDAGFYRYAREVRNPPVTQWTVLHALIAGAESALPATVDCLEDLALAKPNQSIFRDGETRVALRGGRTAAFDTYARIGEGVLPTHYLLDAERRPQLITTSIVSWALSGIA
jgi:hypothetical protein